MQIQTSLLLKPTDLDQHCLQRQGISRLSRTWVNTENMTKMLCLIFYHKYHILPYIIYDKVHIYRRKLQNILSFLDKYSYQLLILKQPITTIVVCLVICFIFANSVDPDQLLWKQSDLGPHCLPVCKNRFEKFTRIFSRRHKQTTFSDAGFLGVLRVKGQITTAADDILIFLTKYSLTLHGADNSHEMPSLVFSEKW